MESGAAGEYLIPVETFGAWIAQSSGTAIDISTERPGAPRGCHYPVYEDLCSWNAKLTSSSHLVMPYSLRVWQSPLKWNGWPRPAVVHAARCTYEVSDELPGEGAFQPIFSTLDSISRRVIMNEAGPRCRNP